MVPEAVIAARTFERRLQLWTEVLPERNHTTFVAYDVDGEICGFASAVALDPPHSGFTSYLQTLYLRTSEKGHGTGRALLSRVARALIARGCPNMALRVLRLNPARGFYEHLGVRFLPNFTYDSGSLDDVAYGFDDLKPLTGE